MWNNLIRGTQEQWEKMKYIILLLSSVSFKAQHIRCYNKTSEKYIDACGKFWWYVSFHHVNVWLQTIKTNSSDQFK
jgi:hypothetical protein